MSIIGCDLHSRYQVIAVVDTDTGEMVTRRLEHENGEARTFYAGLPKPSLIGIEATGYTQWFERLVAELGHELWVGDAAEIRARAVRRQKTDTRDAEHLLDLLLTKRFPRVWVPTPEERDARQLLKHRNKLVRMQTSVRNQLHFLAMSQGVCRKQKLWSARGRAELEGLSLGPWASRRRKELLELLDGLRPRIAELDQAGSGAPSGGGRADEAQGRGAGDRSGLRADRRSGRAFRPQPRPGQLPGIESQRGFQRRSSATGSHQQTRQ